MYQSSKTGLIPVPHNRRRRIEIQQPNDDLTDFFARNLSHPIELSVRPFGDLYNPFQSTRCSVLCNHPAPQILRNIIKNAKQPKSPDGKNYNNKKSNNNNKKNDFDDFELDEQNTIPEELFRRFRDTDSRPMTPSPTNISMQTRTSANGSVMNARRCITPEWGKSDNIKRKQIILDLRRSHSQETIISKGASDLSYVLESKSRISDQQKSSLLIKTSKIDNDDDDTNNIDDDLLPTFNEQPPLEAQQPQPIQSPSQTTCINERDILDDSDIRRGKRRKKLKQQPTFHLNRDPETQISTLGPESVNVSTRPSLIPTTDPVFPEIDQTKRSVESEALKDSFLTVDAFQVLSTNLNVDLLEETFDRYLHRALKEAMKFISLKKPRNSIQENSNENNRKELIKKEKLAFEIDTKMPRKISRSSSRFEIPLDLVDLERISVLDYLSKYVWVSKQRKRVFKQIFLKYLDVTVYDDEQITTDRLMALASFDKALNEILGFYGSDEIIARVNELVEIQKYNNRLTFRTWCGIVAFAERLALLESLKKSGNPDAENDSDSCEELEKSDFDTFEERKVFCTIVPDKLATVLKIIRSVQRSEYWRHAEPFD